ncbi:hypothetical protein QBC39DRAFT_406430 [Podospora conica]|nr:hypothetical protein QBC39DRAFT_406430 [Schizothecium conicum]
MEDFKLVLPKLESDLLDDATMEYSQDSERQDEFQEIRQEDCKFEFFDSGDEDDEEDEDEAEEEEMGEEDEEGRGEITAGAADTCDNGASFPTDEADTHTPRVITTELVCKDWTPTDAFGQRLLQLIKAMSAQCNETEVAIEMNHGVEAQQRIHRGAWEMLKKTKGILAVYLSTITPTAPPADNLNSQNYHNLASVRFTNTTRAGVANLPDFANNAMTVPLNGCSPLKQSIHLGVLKRRANGTDQEVTV